MRVEQTRTYGEDVVSEWCQQSGDHNPIHLDEEVATESIFGGRVVPGVMLLDGVSALLTQLGEDLDEEGDLILAGIVAARFREPVYFDEEVELLLEETSEDKRFRYAEFEVRCVERDQLAAHGTVSFLIE